VPPLSLLYNYLLTPKNKSHLKMIKIWPTQILSSESPEETKIKIVSGYSAAIKNEFFFSESLIEENSNNEKLQIIVQAFRFLRKGIPAKYDLIIEGNDNKTRVRLSSYILVIRVVFFVLCLATVYSFEKAPLILNNYFIDSLVFTILLSFLIMENIKERKTILTAIKKTFI
jgi:hypothetical protein